MDDLFLFRKLSPKCQDLTIVLMIDFKTGPWNILESSLMKPKTHWCLLSKAWATWARVALMFANMQHACFLDVRKELWSLISPCGIRKHSFSTSETRSLFSRDSHVKPRQLWIEMKIQKWWWVVRWAGRKGMHNDLASIFYEMIGLTFKVKNLMS